MILFFLCFEVIRYNAVLVIKDELYKNKIDKLEKEITELNDIIKTKL